MRYYSQVIAQADMNKARAVTVIAGKVVAVEKFGLHHRVLICALLKWEEALVFLRVILLFAVRSDIWQHEQGVLSDLIPQAINVAAFVSVRSLERSACVLSRDLAREILSEGSTYSSTISFPTYF